MQILSLFTKKKKKAEHFFNNYRPISLISNIDKIMKKLVFQRLYLFLEHNNIIYHNQFGFRYNQSTEHALIVRTQEIQDTCDTRALACGVFQKTFDSLKHDILLSKLKTYFKKLVFFLP